MAAPVATPVFAIEFETRRQSDHQGVRQMRTIAIVSGIACFLLLMLAGRAFADSAAIRSMADITMNLNHFPSDEDKEKLAAIAGSSDSNQSERAVATAIANIQHHLAAADKEKLEAVMQDQSAADELRELAGILLSFNHHPSESDRVKLAKIAAGPGG
jgi:cytochrome bd-type quinol oxidase subunit 1